MVGVYTFFNQLNFNFSEDFIPITLSFDNLPTLNEKLSGNSFRYIPENEKTQTTFTLIAVVVSEDEEYEIKNYLWNENKSDLYFINEGKSLRLNYTFTDPRQITPIDSFREYDLNYAQEKISKHNIDTGIFWEVYIEELRLLKRKRFTVDKGLINTLRQLRELLQVEYNHKLEPESRDKIIQALIDRTLFIKYLEDKHIINDFFYEHYFNDKTLNYNKLLKNHKKNEINKLFCLINDIFNNSLFETPKIVNSLLLNNALSLIADALQKKDFKTGQLSLFGYRFDVIPTEFIGHVYEMFFDQTQSEQGIYYTPEGVAKLIVEEVIDRPGKILDPACGSGMFLVVALRKLFEKEGVLLNATVTQIEKRNKILNDSIFGIEKQENACRLTILSLYLELLSGIKSNEIKDFIKKNILSKKEFKLFPYDFSKNILNANALEVNSVNEIKSFDYIIGNPPFHQIRHSEIEEIFWQQHRKHITNRQISQCFLIKIKSFSKENTRFGMVSNLSNFETDNSLLFQNFFYKNYRIITFYNLSEIKTILFENAKESICIIIFDKNITKDHNINYVSPELSNFSKNFKIVLLPAERAQIINQDELVDRTVSLRDFFIGEREDLGLANRISKMDKLYKHLNSKSDLTAYVHNGIQFFGTNNLPNTSVKNTKTIKKEEKDNLKSEILKKHSSSKKTDRFTVGYIMPKNIEPFEIKEPTIFLSKNLDQYKSVFERIRNAESYQGPMVLFSRVGRLKAASVTGYLYFSFDVYAIKPKKKELLLLFTALLNSSLIEYYILIKHKKRASDSYPKISMEHVENLPIPFDLNDKIIAQIIRLSKEVVANPIKYIENKYQLNELIFDLYNLDFVSRQRIKDFFIPFEIVKRTILDSYVNTYVDIVKTHIPSDIEIFVTQYFEQKITSFVGVKFSFVKGSVHVAPPISTLINHTLIELTKDIGNKNIYALQDKIYFQNCVYIIRENNRKKWSETNAIEDAKDFLNKLFNEH